MPNLITEDVESEVSLLASPGQKLFSFGFAIFEAADLIVTKNGFACTYTAVPATSLQYNITGIGEDDGGHISFGAGLDAGDLVVLSREVPIRRSIDIPTTGPFSADIIDEEFDRVFAIQQQLRSTVRRALTVPVGDTAPEFPEVPVAPNRFLTSTSTGAMAWVEIDLGAGNTYNLTGTTAAVSRAGMAAIGGAISGQTCYLAETGREGMFVFVTGDMTTHIANDPNQGVFVAGNGGTWVRKGGPLRPTHFGCTDRMQTGALQSSGNWHLAGLSSVIATWTDDTANLNAYFAFLARYRLPADYSGIYAVTGKVQMGLASTAEPAYDQTDAYTGSMVLVVKPGGVFIPIVLDILSPGHCSYGPITITADTSSTYSAKIFGTGIRVKNRTQFTTFTTLRVFGARYWGAIGESPNSPLDNLFSTDWGNSFFVQCGAGSALGAPDSNFTRFLATTYTKGVRSGAQGVDSQTQTITLGELWPEDIDALQHQDIRLVFDTGNGTIPKASASNGYKGHRVISFDRATKTVQVSPWVKAAVAASGTCHLSFGGGLCLMGGDSGVTKGKITTNTCAKGLHNAALYPGIFNLTAQSCYQGYMIGKVIPEVVVGGGLENYYAEGNTWDIVWNAGRAQKHRIFSEHSLNIAKIDYQFPLYSSDAERQDLQPTAFDLNWRGADRRVITKKSEALYNACIFGFDRPVGDVLTPHDNFVVFYFDEHDEPEEPTNSDADIERVFGRLSRIAQVTGTGAGNKPTGTITVNCSTYSTGWKINGGAIGADLVLSGPFTGPVTLQFSADLTDPANPNLLVSVMGGM